MKNALIFIAIIAAGCGGTLSEEQRRKLKEGMEANKIVRATDADIMATSLAQAQRTYDALKQVGFDKAKIDSLEEQFQVNIRWIVPGEENARQLERELIEAYVLGMAEGQSGENLQKIWTSPEKNDYDSLLYSRPSVTRRDDGSEQLDGLWNIYLARRDMVRQIGENQ